MNAIANGVKFITGVVLGLSALKWATDQLSDSVNETNENK